MNDKARYLQALIKYLLKKVNSYLKFFII